MPIDQKLGDLGVDGPFVLALVFDDLLDGLGRLQNQRRRVVGVGMIERIRDFSQMIKRGFDALMIVTEGDARPFWHFMSE